MGIVMVKSDYDCNRILASFYGILALIVTITYLLAFVSALYAFFSPEGSSFASQSYKILKINALYFWSVSVQLDVKASEIFLLLNGIFALAFLTAFFSNERWHSSIKLMLTEGRVGLAKRNFLAVMPGITSATLLLTTALNLLEEKAGVSVGGPSFTDPFSEIFTLSYAAISEEIGFRLVPILLPVAVYVLIKTRRLLRGVSKRSLVFMIFVAMLKPESYQRRIGFKPDQGLRVLEVLLILISSSMFSYAHMLYGTWGLGKIPSTFFAGLVIGYCSVRYGFDSAVLLHWFFNYYWSALSLAMMLPPHFAMISDVAYILTVYLGTFSLVFFAFSLLVRRT